METTNLVAFIVLQTIIFTFLYLMYNKHCDSEYDNKPISTWDPVSEELIFKMERIESELLNANIKIITLTNKMDDINKKLNNLLDDVKTSSQGTVDDYYDTIIHDAKIKKKEYEKNLEDLE